MQLAQLGRLVSSAGRFSFPAVPPDAELTYEVELIGFEPVDEVDGAPV